MINIFKAIEIIINNIKKYHRNIKFKKKYIDKTENNINKNKIIAKINIPSFKNSAMDGFAINYKEYIKKKKKIFKIVSKIKAGDNISQKNKKYAIKIMTGGKIPKNLDAVIKIEDVKKSKNLIFINKKIKKNENIKNIGEDIKKNDTILYRGNNINSNSISVLASLGIKKINVLKKPNFYLISTGNEIINKNYKFNKNFLIHNSTSSYIKNFFKSINTKIKYLGSIKDEEILFINKLKNITNLKYFSTFITTGAVSKGDHDFIPKTLKKLGIKTLFHNINIKPGKPILFGKYKKHIFFFCLPGNPISSIIGIRIFVYQFIKYFTTQKIENPLEAILINSSNIKIKKHTFLKGYAFIKNAKIFVKILKNQESFKIKPLLISNCFIFLKKNDKIKKNKKIKIIFYKPTKF